MSSAESQALMMDLQAVGWGQDDSGQVLGTGLLWGWLEEACCSLMSLRQPLAALGSRQCWSLRAPLLSLPAPGGKCSLPVPICAAASLSMHPH